MNINEPRGITKYDVFGCFIVAVLLVAVFAGAWGLGVASAAFSCHKYEQANGVQTKMIWGECYVPSGKSWVPLSRIRGEAD